MSRRFSPLLFCLAAAGCTNAQRIKAETVVANALISEDQERLIGNQLKADLEKEHLKLLNDPMVTAYVNQVAAKVIAQAQHDRPRGTLTVHVVDDPKTVNAFAIPGGDLYIMSGLLLSADNEAELAGIIGHESGHVVARHAARQMVEQHGIEAVLALAAGKNPGTLEKIAAALGEKGVLLANSRADENEADTYGARYASGAGYDPHGLIQFFQKLQANQGHTPRALSLLQTHPANGDRIAKVNQYIDQNHLTGSELGAGRLQPVQNRLQQLGGGRAAR